MCGTCDGHKGDGKRWGYQAPTREGVPSREAQHSSLAPRGGRHDDVAYIPFPFVAAQGAGFHFVFTRVLMPSARLCTYPVSIRSNYFSHEFSVALLWD